MRIKTFSPEFLKVEEATEDILTVILRSSGDRISIDLNGLMDNELVIEELDSEHVDALIAIIPHSLNTHYIHIKSNVVYSTPYLNNNSVGSIDLKVEVFSERFIVTKQKYTYSITDKYSLEEFFLDDSLFEEGNKPLFVNNERSSEEPYIYLKVEYCNYVSFLEYTIKGEQYSIKTSKFELFNNPSNLQIEFKSTNQFVLKGKANFNKVFISNLIKNKFHVLSEETDPSLKLPNLLMINNRLYVINSDEKKRLLIYYDKRAELLFEETEFLGSKKRKGFLIRGKIKYRFDIPIDTLITADGNLLGVLEWENKNEFKVYIEESSLKELVNIHNPLWFGIGSKTVHSMYRFLEKEPTQIVEESFNNDKKAYVLRLNKASIYTLSILPELLIYNKFNKFKIKTAGIISKIIPKLFRGKQVNLFFEKEASRACESSRAVFEKIMNDYELDSKNIFILDKNSDSFHEMKSKFNGQVVKRFSFRHYLYMFYANTYISSELSTHVIASRVFNDKLNELILKTPLYFLQHGIMFAKPVDNPMALNFHKENVNFNIRKSVISSDLEAKEFYKMGYDDNDLMKTGLPKLDHSKINSTADKITYMPTWRYWEEQFIINDEIERTTYFQSLMNVIKLFEEEGLINRLLIAPHNKFSAYISKYLKEYEHIICNDPTDALKVSQVFITDYSSIIYDSIYQGGYPIFYWKDAEYLIDNYKAIPPVNEGNAPGIIVKNDEQLMKAIKSAIENNYKISRESIEKYRAINEFNDDNNTQRVIDILVKDNIL